MTLRQAVLCCLMISSQLVSILATVAVVDTSHRVTRLCECSNCHRPPQFTSDRSYDVGLLDTAGNRAFNPPSLRGVWQRRAFFHDASAAPWKRC